MTAYIRDFSTLGRNDTAEAFVTSMSQVRDDLAAELTIALDRGTSAAAVGGVRRADA